MNKIVPSNQELLKELFENYYHSDNTPENLISSHWEYYSEKFNVQIDDEGNIISLKGVGFGDMADVSIISKIFAYIGHVSYFVRLPYKRDLYHLILKSLKICSLMGVFFSFDCFKQACSLSLIKRNLREGMRNKRLTFLIIGDGYGFLSGLIKSTFPDSTVVLVDLGKTLLFQAYYCQKVHPNSSHYGINQKTIHKKNNLEECDFIYCPTEYLDNISSIKYDIVVNIASMQEMNISTVNRYFDFIRHCSNENNLFYCCNREQKILKGGEILEFENYSWRKYDQHLVDEYCPWYKYFLSLSSTKNGPKILGIRIPIINYFDGPIRHRLTKMSISNQES